MKFDLFDFNSRISKKAFEIEREHDHAIQQAKQRLQGVTLKSETELTELREEKTQTATAIQSLKKEFTALNAQIQRFDRHHSLTETLRRSNEALLDWKNADTAFAPDREKLTRHTATQPFQADLNHLRPHGSLGYISPIEFEQKLEAESSTQGKGSSRPSASFRPSLDLLYTFNHYINPSRPTV